MAVLASENRDVRALICESIALIRELTRRHREFVETWFSDETFHRALSLHHLGLLIPKCRESDLVDAVRSEGFDVLSVFPSTVVSSQLAERFGKEVEIRIHKTGSVIETLPTLEVFTVINGLDDNEVRGAIPDVTHIAYLLQQKMDSASLCRKLQGEGFSYSGGGFNSDDSAPFCDGLTVLYFSKVERDNEVPKIEIVLPGRHELPSLLHGSGGETGK